MLVLVWQRVEEVEGSLKREVLFDVFGKQQVLIEKVNPLDKIKLASIKRRKIGKDLYIEFVAS